MSSIMRSRSALPGRCEGSEVIGGSSLELKVAGPSMLGIGCPDRHALPLTHAPPSPKIYRPRRASSRESGFVLCPLSDLRRWVSNWLGWLERRRPLIGAIGAYGGCPAPVPVIPTTRSCDKL